MAQEPDIDPNRWYSMYIGSHTQAMVGTVLYDGDGSRGAVFIKTRNDTETEQRWQLLKLSSTAWTLRSQGSGPNSYLSAIYSDDEQQEGKSSAYMARGDIADASAYWTITSWGDETWYLTNLANKTDYHLTLTPNAGHIVMSSNITAPQKGQKWEFLEIAAIDDERYSSVNLVDAMTSTATAISRSSTPSGTASATSSANANANTSSGLPTAAKAGIGAGVGGAALIALIVLGLFLLRKRKRGQYTTPPQELPHESMAHVQSPALIKYEPNHDNTTTYEMPYNNAVSEAPMNERPAELPGHTVHR
ncbi:hypothetical protein G6011_06190 [Alternaria panax]|uniref:Ricin B lectin domain-containing protein n=1 Tax=Alternaria panax TaxID=48097 RepID=A0AAD4FFW5_9PLEO|nr:hypothetical protein G6011_06190 [Alternaria panax]